MSKYRLAAILTIIVIVLGFVGGSDGLRNHWWNGRDDYRLGSLTEEGIGIISISPERRMINQLKVEGETKIWVPWGLGWYRADKLKRLLAQEGKTSRLNEVLFYNFGFWPDGLVDGGNSGWSNWKNLWWGVGMVNTVRIKMAMGGLLPGEDEIKGDLAKDKSIDEILWRDFADNRLVNEGVRLTVVNGSLEPGLANWLAKRLEWAGLSVVDTESVALDNGKCRIAAGLDAKSGYGYQILNKYWDCKEETGLPPVGNEVVLYLGQEFAQMVKYHNYSN